MFSRADLERAYDTSVNVKAFYMVVRRGESSLTDDAYQMVNGGGKFFDFSKHPYAGMSTLQGGRAAGASQFIPSTWADLADKYGFTGFTPREQDLGYVGCLVKRNALEDVIAGRFDTALEKCRKEWTSLPGAAENNPSWTYEKAVALYKQYGGILANESQPAAPIEDRSVPAQTTEGPKMGAALFIPAILQMIPALVGIFGKGDNAAKNQKAAQTVVDAFTAAVPGAANAQDAVEKAAADPAVKAAAAAAVLSNPVIEQLMEIGPTGIKEARAANVQMLATADKWWKLLLNPVLLVTLFVLPLVYMFVYAMTFGRADVGLMGKVSADVLSQTMGTVIGLALGGIMGFWMGQTYQSSNGRRVTDQQPAAEIK